MSRLAQVIVNLEPDLEEFVRDEIERGSFTSSSDYIHQLLEQRYEQDRAQRLKELDEALDKGVADADAGRLIPLDEAFEGVKKALGLDKIRAQ